MDQHTDQDFHRFQLALLTALHSGPLDGLRMREDFLIQCANVTLERRLQRSPFCAAESFEDVRDYARTYLNFDFGRERAGVILLDADRRLIEISTLCEGTLGRVPVAQREIFRAALSRNAGSLIFWHSHPTRSAAPSLNDLRSLQIDLAVAAALEIQILDAVILAPGGDYFSSAEAGLLDPDTLKAAIALHPCNAAERLTAWTNKLMSLWRLWWRRFPR